MKIRLKTHVQAPFEEVVAGFNLELLQALAPPFPRLKIIQYDEGNRTGNRIHFKLDFLLYQKDWMGTVTDHSSSDDQFYFVDESRQLPMGMRYWQHRHEIRRENQHTIIVDVINYTTERWLLDLFLYPLIWFQFLYRIPGYKSYFKKKATQ